MRFLSWSIWIWLNLALGLAVQAQSQVNLDSLFAVWQDPTLTDDARLRAINNIAWDGHLYSQPDSALYYAQLQYDFAKRRGLKGHMASALNTQGASRYVKGDFAGALGYYQQCLELQEEIGDKRGMASNLNNMGNMYEAQGDYAQALACFQRSLALKEEIGNQTGIANSLVNMGAVYSAQGDYPQALNCYQRSLKIFEEREDQRGMAAALGNLGVVYEKQGDYARALQSYQRSLTIKGEVGDRRGAAVTLHNMGIISYSQGDHAQAMAYAQRSLKIHEEIGDEDGIAGSLNSMGIIYADQNDYPQALAFYQRSLAIREKIGDKAGVAMTLHNLGIVFEDQGDYDRAMDCYQRSLMIQEEIGDKAGIAHIKKAIGGLYQQTKAPAKAVGWCRQALSLAEETGSVEVQQYACRCLYEAHKALGRNREALGYHEQWVRLRDSLFSQANTKEITRLEVQYEYQQQALQDSLTFVQAQADTELAYQAQLNQRNLLLTGAAIVLLLGALGFLYFRYRQQQRNRARELELARERERKEQLAELDKLKSRFFANISHELRTPLTLILGQNQSLQAELDDPRIDPKFDMVDRNGRRLLELVNQVLDLSKLESGRLELNVQTFDLLPFLKNLLFSFESLADQKRQQLQFQSREESLLMVADPEKLERVFFNLLSNAVKFTPEGGRITLKLQMVAHRVHVGVLDTGVGIPAEQQAAIFDRFYQSESGANHPSPGTGIGLALVKELVELHEGSVELRSEPGQGSEFWVNLPLNAGIASETPATYEPRLEPLEAAVALPAAPTTSGKSRITHAESRILIVEDNSDVRSFLRQELLGMGYAVLEAEDGQTGLDKAKAEQPDLIISDVMMPKMDGFELAQAIRADANSSHVPLILLTAKGSEESRITGLQTGVDDYLTKPFNPRELQARVANLIAQRKRLQEKFATALTIKPEEVSAVPMDQQFLQQVTDTIEAHLTDEQFGVEGLAETAGMSVTHLNRKLKALIGQTAGKLIRSMRLQRAADLLRQGAGNVSDIGYELCFSDSANFARAFKAQFGVTPSQWREQNAGAAAPE